MENIGKILENLIEKKTGWTNSWKAQFEKQKKSQDATQSCMAMSSAQNSTQTTYQKKTSEQILLECKEKCSGPAACPFRGYIPRPDDPIVVVPCDIYARYRQQREIDARLQEMLPKKYWECTLDNYETVTDEQKEAIATVKHYIHLREWEQGTGLLFLGNSGTGKTHLAVATARELARQGAVVLFVMAQDLLEFADKEGQKLLRSVDVLVIDDLVDELMDAVTMRFFHRTVNYRIADEKANILTTTFSLDELRRKLGDRTTNHLFSGSRAVFFQKTPSYKTLQKKNPGPAGPGRNKPTPF